MSRKPVLNKPQNLKGVSPVVETTPIYDQPCCATCAFYRIPGIGRGFCRRYPQVVLKMPIDWCGEYAAGKESNPN